MKSIKNSVLHFIKKNWLYIIIILIVIASISGCIYIHYFKPYKIDKDFSKVDISKSKKLMVVAHPDDEFLWGGAHLLEDDYLVVCITCGPNKVRVNEFTSVMAATNDSFIMLGYPDKTNGERDNWDSCREDIKNDLKEIIALKDWETIVTHNPQGEYGHIHHKMTSAIMTDVVTNKDKFYYFGRYHSKKNIPDYYNSMTPINDEYIKPKKHILGLYQSQSFIQTSFEHIYEYEDWESYNEWMAK